MVRSTSATATTHSRPPLITAANLLGGSYPVELWVRGEELNDRVAGYHRDGVRGTGQG